MNSPEVSWLGKDSHDRLYRQWLVSFISDLALLGLSLTKASNSAPLVVPDTS